MIREDVSAYHLTVQKPDSPPDGSSGSRCCGFMSLHHLTPLATVLMRRACEIETGANREPAIIAIHDQLLPLPCFV